MKSLPLVSTFLALSLAMASAQDTSGPARPLDDLLTADAAWQMNAAQFDEKFKATRFAKDSAWDEFIEVVPGGGAN